MSRAGIDGLAAIKVLFIGIDAHQGIDSDKAKSERFVAIPQHLAAEIEERSIEVDSHFGVPFG